MTTFAIETRMTEMTIGYTTTINDHVVTRWTSKTWEVDTLGRKTVGLDVAVSQVK